MPTLRHRFALLLSLALTSRTAGAVALDWSNPLDGSANIATNWTPSRVPAAADVLVFAINPVNADAVNFGAGVDTVASHVFTAGRVILAASVPHFGTSVFAVAPNTGSTATATLVSGALRAGADVRIGDASGANGTLVVSGAGTLFRHAGGGSFHVGRAGTGLVQVTGGAQSTLASDVVVGSQSGSGALSVAGFTGGPATRSRLSVGTDAPVRSTFVGRTGGRGTLLVADGDLSIGIGSRRIDGNLELGAHHLDGFGHLTLGGRTTMEGGGLSPVTTVLAGGVFTGHGAANDSLTVDGELVLGAPHGRLHGEGMLRVNGTFTLELGAKSGARDTLAVDGTLHLLGVVNVEPKPGFDWHPGDSVAVGQYWGADTHLTSLRFDGVAVPGQLELHAHANQIWLVFMPSFAAVGDAPPATALRFAATDSPGPRASLARVVTLR